MAVPCMHDRPHLFLTGEKGVGKSTLLKKLLGRRKASGFWTVKSCREGQTALHLLRPGEGPGEENLLCLCPPPGDEASARRFDLLGCAALEEGGGEVIVMDELGPGEAKAEAFQAAVLKALEGSTPVLGVLQKGDYPLFHRIADHPRVHLVEVTVENREGLMEELT